MTLAPSILLIDDDSDTETAVRLALEPRVNVLVETTLAEALKFLNKRIGDVCGVIVDLNLTTSTDNFGREILAELRKNDTPCVVFSSSIKTAADIERYKNEFGVLGAIGKGAATSGATSSLQQLRNSVAKMVERAIEQQRTKTRIDVEQGLAACRSRIAWEETVSNDAGEELKRVTGTLAAQNFADTEKLRLKGLRDAAGAYETAIMKRVREARSVTALRQIQDEVIASVDAEKQHE